MSNVLASSAIFDAAGLYSRDPLVLSSFGPPTEINIDVHVYQATATNNYSKFSDLSMPGSILHHTNLSYREQRTICLVSC